MVQEELRDGAVIILDGERLYPGQSTYCLLLPLRDWPELNRTQQLEAYEGTKLVATARVFGTFGKKR